MKFTASGAIQPFILPVDSLMPNSLEVSRIRKTILSKLPPGEYTLVAVGVADTGCGLSKETLSTAEAGLTDIDSSGVTNGAKNSGFGLHMAHQLASTFGSKVFLGDLAHCHSLLNDDISDAFRKHQSSLEVANDKSSSLFGSVLYIVVPVFVNGDRDNKRSESNTTIPEESPFKFQPQPPKMSNDCFRILIADDVFILRKGLVHSVLQVFENIKCPVSIYTANTAEDALRLIKSQTFDIVISDNQFVPPANQISNDGSSPRPCVVFDGTNGTRRGSNVSTFFSMEQFTLEKGDGDLSGLKALLHLVDSTEIYPKPILILLSGHKFDLDPSLGLIVAQKPLKTSEIVPLLESSAQQLIDAEMCSEVEGESGEEMRVVNQRGSTLFIRKI